MFCAQRVRVTGKGKPGHEAWAVYRRNLDGSEPRYYLSNAPEDTTLETLACCGVLFLRRAMWTNTRPALGGWHHFIAMCLLGGAFLLGLLGFAPV